jgi:hypothetical protein
MEGQEKLLTIKNYAMKHSVTAAYIYTLIKREQMKPVVIDGVQFIDESYYASFG